MRDRAEVIWRCDICGRRNEAMKLFAVTTCSFCSVEVYIGCGAKGACPQCLSKLTAMHPDLKIPICVAKERLW